MSFNLTHGWLDDPASPGVIESLSSDLAVGLPGDYLDFLAQHNGGEGFIGEKLLILWKAEELAQFNREYEVNQYAPGFILFGSSGGGEDYGFDVQSAAMPIVRIPFIGMERRYAEHVAEGFRDLFGQAGGRAIGAAPDPRSRNMECVEITPVMLGGDPINPDNKAWLTRQQHFEMVRYWNRAIRHHRQTV